MFNFFKKNTQERFQSISPLAMDFAVPPDELTYGKISVEIKRQRKFRHRCAIFPNSTISTRLRRELRQQGYIPHCSLDSEYLPRVTIFW